MDLKNKNVLITGADGFIGSHLTEKLIGMGANVSALAQYNSFNSWGWLDTLDSSLKAEIEVITGDIRDADNVFKLVEGKDVVFHLAALIAIPYSYQSPMAYVKTNIEGTLNILEASRRYNIEKIIHTSTSEVYGSATYIPIDEKHPLQGQSPYSASKIGADMLAASYYKSFGVPVATIRPFNTYGPRQSARAVIPTIISQLLAGKKAIQLGALYPTRDLNFVADTVNGFVRMAEVDSTVGKTVNIGTGKEISIGCLATKLMDITGCNAEIKSDEERIRPENSEVNRLCCDNKTALEILGWSPTCNIDDGLKQTVDWIRNNMEYYKVNIYNI